MTPILIALSTRQLVGHKGSAPTGDLPRMVGATLWPRWFVPFIPDQFLMVDTGVTFKYFGIYEALTEIIRFIFSRCIRTITQQIGGMASFLYCYEDFPNMSIQNLLNQFVGSSDAVPSSGAASTGIGDTLSKLSASLPSGLAGGAAAGGIMALLVGNKSARKFAGKAATYGGAAVLGGLAYRAFQNWQQNSTSHSSTEAGSANIAIPDRNAFAVNGELPPAFELTLIKAMIAAAKADGHIDATEQQRIFKAVDQMDLPIETKGVVFDLLRQEISVEELASGAGSIEQKSELYLASCLAIDPDSPSEQAHLDRLASALGLPEGLPGELQWQAKKALAEAA